MNDTTADTLIRREGRAGRITLNRPKALNALTYAQVGEIWQALNAWISDPSVDLVLLDGAGDRAFCAGGDVLWLHASAREGSAKARAFWSEEYRLNALIGRFPKPLVAIQDGIVMGGGIGLSSHAQYRIVTERSMLAMPETGIGLIPDVGGTWLLGHAQGELGIYLGLTGARMDASDAIQCGFSSTFMPSAGLEGLKRRLVAGTDPIDEIVAEIEEQNPVPPSRLAESRPVIDRIFSAPSVEQIIADLNTTTDPIAQKARAELMQKSPKALKLTLAAIRQARQLPSLEHALNVEYRLCARLFEDGEFIEGVRALLVDKDRSPRWQPPRLEDVTQGLVESYLAPLPASEELALEPPA